MKVDPRLAEITDGLYRLAVRGIILHDNKLLMVRDDPGDDWAFPGGGIDYGESPEVALVRELKEEINLHIDMMQSSPEFAYINTGHTKNSIPRANIHYFLNVIDPEKLSKGHDIQEFKWVSLDELDHLTLNEVVGDIMPLLPMIQARLR